MDEKPYQLLAHARDPIPARPGQDALRTPSTCATAPARSSCGSSRWPGGAGSTPAPADQDRLGRQVKQLLTVDYPDAETVVLVMDNLNTHSIASLYEAFQPRGLRARAATGDPPHPQTRVLAQHRRDRALRPDPPMPGPPHQRPRHPQHRARRLADRDQHRPASSRLAVHHRRRPHQTPPPIPQLTAATLY